MAMSVDKKSRRSVHSTSDAPCEVGSYTSPIRSNFKGFSQCAGREFKLLGKRQIERFVQAILVFK